MATHKRNVVTLDNGKSIFVYNMDTNAVLPSTLVLSGKPEVSETDSGDQYRFSHAESGWFGSINADDTDRLSSVLQVKSGDIVVRVKALVTYTESDIKSAKPFAPAKAK